MTNFETIFSSLRQSGIGLTAIEGAWWSLATAPWQMSSREYKQLSAIGRAVFAFTDAVAEELCDRPDGAFAQQLRYKVPRHIVQRVDFAPLLSFRPDFQLLPTAARLQFVLTEIEAAPFSHGCAQALQEAYDLTPDTAATFAKMLNGRELLIVGTHEWSVYQFDQLAFCKMLAALGARGRVLYDRSVPQMETEIQQGLRWALPVRGVDNPPEPWQPGMVSHIERHDLQHFVLDEWPDQVGDAVIFRFGYVEHFTPEQHQMFKKWQLGGATFLNPFSYHLDSKVMLQGVRSPSIRQRLDDQTVSVLDSCIPETQLLTEEKLPGFIRERQQWVIKFAGFDLTNAAWGGLSVNFGRDYAEQRWAELLNEAARLNWPVVAQRLTPTRQLTFDYYRDDGSIATQVEGYSRLRTFFLRRDKDDSANSVHCGSHITVTAAMNVSEQGQGAIQMPVRFRLP